MAGMIKITQQGQSGKIQYSEGWLQKNVCEFYWEFSGGDTLATVWFPAEDKWDEKYPWARGRQKEIVTSVAEQVRRQQAPRSSIRWEADRFHLVQG